LNHFLSDIALDESFGKKNARENQDRLVLSTIHQAKGVEWEAVFLINLASGCFPNERALGEPGGEEEERRLFYVGITRAKKRIYLLWAVTRNIFGSVRVNVESRFLDDIPDELKNSKSLSSSPFSKGRESGSPLSKRGTKGDFKDGQRVRHNTFGEGVVISTEKDIITIAFMKAGIKKLSTKFAELEKV